MPEIWGALRTLTDVPADGALVTILRTEGSAYQREGTKMIYRVEGEPVGTISGGCLEADLYERCAEAIRSGRPLAVTYTPAAATDGVFGVGTGCEGTIEVLVEPVAPWRTEPGRALLAEIARRIAAGERFAVVTLVRRGGEVVSPLERLIVGGERSPEGRFGDPGLEKAAVESARQALEAEVRRPSRNVRLSAGGKPCEVLIDVVVPAEPLVVFGAGEDARPLVRIADEIGMAVSVVDWRPELLRAERFSDAARLCRVRPEDFPGELSLARRPAIVLMSHNYVADRAVLGRLLRGPESLAYLAVLGPRARTARLVAELKEGGGALDPEKVAAIRTPAGLDVGADTPAEIALSIAAEILAVRKRARGVLLREAVERRA